MSIVALGITDLLVFGWKSDNKPVGNTNCCPNTEALSVSADQLSAKGCLP
ncbi:MAG: hypothetical protein LBC02_12360 [Planctomycetaceae bacterium]|nr:hypothetical protein [Planctomycetaceae bacterium]